MADNNAIEQYLIDNAENNQYMGKDAPAYAPQRDITTLFPVAVNQLWDDIVGDDWNKRYSALMKKWGFVKEQVLTAFNLYVDSLMNFRHDVAATFDEAATLSGFSELNPRIVLLVEAMVGRYMAAAYFYGLKDICIKNETPPPFSGYDTFQKLLEEIKNGFDGTETDYARQIKRQGMETSTEEEAATDATEADSAVETQGILLS